MKKILLLLFMLSCVFAYGQNPSVTIVNNTGYEFWSVYISPSSSSEWGDDRLAADQVIANGESVRFSLPFPLSEESQYDFKVLDLDGDSYFKMRIPLVGNDEIVFVFSDIENYGGDGDGDYYPEDEMQGPSITIVNNTGSAIWNVFVSSSASHSWGDDRLGSGLIQNGESVELQLPFPINVVNRYDILLTNAAGSTFTKFDVLVSPDERIEFTSANRDKETDWKPNTAPRGEMITIVNNTGYPIMGALIRPFSSSAWGENRLEVDQIISNGESITLRLPLPLNTSNRFDIRLTDTDKDTYTKVKATVSAGGRIVFTFDDFDR
jgi:hypothetical protein